MEETHYDHLLSLVRKQNVRMNNSSPFLMIGSTSSMFRTPHSPAGEWTQQFRDLSVWLCDSQRQPLSSQLSTVLPKHGKKQQTSPATTLLTFPYSPSLYLLRKRRHDRSKHPESWAQAAGCQIYRGAEVRLPRQTLFWCFETSLRNCLGGHLIHTYTDHNAATDLINFWRVLDLTTESQERLLQN